MRNLLEYSKQETGCNCRADNAGYVRTHSVHQQEVGRVCLLTNLLGNTGSHRHCGYTGRTDQRIDLTAADDIHHLAAQQTADCREAECQQTQNHDLQGIQGQEGRSNSSCTNGDTEEYGCLLYTSDAADE